MIMEATNYKKYMWKFIVVLGIGLFTSCGSSQNASENLSDQTTKVEEAEENVMSSERPLREEDLINVEGTVRVNDKGCPFYIEMIEGDLFSLVYPVNLEDKYKVDGKKLIFNFIPSRAQSVEGCEAQRVITLLDVKEK